MTLPEGERAHPTGHLPAAQIEKLAQGLFAEWKGSDPKARQAMVEQAYAMEPGCERRAALKFLKLREAHLGRGWA